MRRALLYISALVIGGCSFQASCGTKKLNTKKGEEMLEAAVEKESGLPVDSVTCPTDVKMKKGDIFDCKVMLAGVEGTYRITQTDDDGNVDYELVEGWIFSSKLEPMIVGKLKEATSVQATVDCGPRVHDSKPGDKFECKATAPNGEVLRIGVDVTDALGGVNFKVIGAPEGGAAPATPEGAAPHGVAPTGP